jgi:uncharacterized protein (DUF2141 family)
VRRKWPFVVILLAFCLAGVGCAHRGRPAASQPGPGGEDPARSGPVRLTVRVVGLESEAGEVALAIYDSAESFDDRSGAVATAWIQPGPDGTALWEVDELAPGRYAVAAYHDRNANGKLDRSALGPPSEPYGFSNDARGSFGPPKFAKAVLELGPGEHSVEIRLR